MNVPTTWREVPEAALRRVADVFGPSGDAYRAVRQGIAIQEQGLPAAFYYTGTAIVAISTQGKLL